MGVLSFPGFFDKVFLVQVIWNHLQDFHLFSSSSGVSQTVLVFELTGKSFTKRIPYLYYYVKSVRDLIPILQ